MDLGEGGSAKAEDAVTLVQMVETKDRFKKARLVWKIHDFAKMLEVAEKAELEETSTDLVSPKYSVALKAEQLSRSAICKREEMFSLMLKWNNGRNIEEETRTFIGLFLQPPKDLFISYTFKISGADDRHFQSRDVSWLKTKENEACGFSKLMSKVKFKKCQNHLLVDGALTITCELEIMCSHPQSNSMQSLQPTPSLTLGEQLRTNLESADVTIVWKSGGDGSKASSRPMPKRAKVKETSKTFPCHKLVLSSRSEVFAAMFAHANTAESQSSSITIVDMSLKGLEAFLNFLYTDKSEYLDTSTNLRDVVELLATADKYNVQSLKTKAEVRLSKMACVSNIRDIVQLSELHNAGNLKKFAVNFLAKKILRNSPD